MKNFRKVLALVLVVATLFSFTAMTSAAYEDADKISYKQAVDVLSAVGVLNGYEVAEDEFEFHPTDTISREEMAKMIAVMCNAGDDVSKLYASACTFADVAKTRWSASYVAYCAKTGIVAGRSASTFDPTGKVTGLETAKMLLVALGFDPSVQGYTGADWKVNTLRDAKAVGLLKGFAAGYDIDVAITREEAAQMMLNALLGRVVIGHLSDAARIVVTNKYFANSGMDNVDWTLIDAKGSAKLYGKVVISDTTLWQALYGGNLKISETANRDCFGRPATVWTWTDSKGKTTPIGTYPATPVWTSADTTAAAVLKEIKTYIDNEKYEFGKAWVDGKSGKWTGYGENNIGNGTQVEIYVVGNEIDVVIINTYVGTVTHAQTPTGKVGIVKADGTVGYVKNTYGYGVADEGKTVLYWVCKDGIHAVEEPETKTVTLHAIRNVPVNFCDTDENVYEPGFTAGAKNIQDAVDALLAKKAKLYFDKNGFVMKVEAVGAEKKVSILVNDSALEDSSLKYADNTTAYTYTAQFVEFEASPKASDAIGVNVSMWNKDVADTSVEDVLLKWTVDAYGNRTVAEGDFGLTQAAPQGTKWLLKKESGQIVNDATPAVAFPAVGNEATQYILRVKNASTGLYEYKYFDGCDKIDATYVLDDLQYFTAAAPAHYNVRTLTYVYASASTVKASSTAFVLSYATSEVYKEVGGQAVGYELFNAIINGEPAYVAYKYADITGFAALTNAIAAAKDNDPATLNVVNKAVKSNYYYVITETHDDKPVYVASSVVTESDGEDFLVIGNLLTYVKNEVFASLPMAEGAKVIVIADYKADNVKGYTDEIKTLGSYAELEYYLNNHGWDDDAGYAYIQQNASGAVTYLYLFVKEA